MVQNSVAKTLENSFLPNVNTKYKLLVILQKQNQRKNIKNLEIIATLIYN